MRLQCRRLRIGRRHLRTLNRVHVTRSPEERYLELRSSTFCITLSKYDSCLSYNAYNLKPGTGRVLLARSDRGHSLIPDDTDTLATTWSEHEASSSSRAPYIRCIAQQHCLRCSFCSSDKGQAEDWSSILVAHTTLSYLFQETNLDKTIGRHLQICHFVPAVLSHPQEEIE